MEKKTIGGFIAVLRKASGMTQRQLAEMLGVSDKAVSRWERDEALPDLTMIPVLAEIFGVTADELLRGQKNAAEAPAPQSEEKSKKQLQYLLDRTRTDYKICTYICVLVAVVGVIAAALINLAFLRAILGFWVGCIFFVTAAVLQLIFKIKCDARLQGEQLEGEALTACKKQVEKYTYWGFAVIAALFASTLPLMGVEDAYAGLNLYGWMHPYTYTTSSDGSGVAYVSYMRWPQPGLVVLLLAGLGKWLPQIRHLGPKGKLRLRSAALLLVILVVTVIAHGIFGELLHDHRHWTGQGTAHESVEAFQEFIQTPLTWDGEPYTYEVLDWNDQGGIRWVEYYDEHMGEYAQQGENVGRWNGQELRYIHLNFTVRYVDTHHDGAAIYTYTDAQLERANLIIDWILYPLLIVYPIEIFLVWRGWRRKEKHL